MDERYEAPSLAVIGEITQLTAGGDQGGIDQSDGNGSAPLPPPSDARLKHRIGAL